MSIPTKLLILVAAFLLGLSAGWKIKSNADAAGTLTVQKQEVKQGNQVNAEDAQTARQHEADRQRQQRLDAAMAQQTAIAAAQPDYHTCELKPQDLQLLNDAITGGQHAPAN